MNGDIFNGAGDWQPQLNHPGAVVMFGYEEDIAPPGEPPMVRAGDPYKVALVKIGVELDALPPLPTVEPVEVPNLKKIKKPDLVTAYQSLQAAYAALLEYTHTIRPALEVVRDTAEETLLQ